MGRPRRRRGRPSRRVRTSEIWRPTASVVLVQPARGPAWRGLRRWSRLLPSGRLTDRRHGPPKAPSRRRPAPATGLQGRSSRRGGRRPRLRRLCRRAGPPTHARPPPDRWDAPHPERGPPRARGRDPVPVFVQPGDPELCSARARRMTHVPAGRPATPDVRPPARADPARADRARGAPGRRPEPGVRIEVPMTVAVRVEPRVAISAAERQGLRAAISAVDRVEHRAGTSEVDRAERLGVTFAVRRRAAPGVTSVPLDPRLPGEDNRRCRRLRPPPARPRPARGTAAASAVSRGAPRPVMRFLARGAMSMSEGGGGARRAMPAPGGVLCRARPNHRASGPPKWLSTVR